jgi:hypothetical protein
VQEYARFLARELPTLEAPIHDIAEHFNRCRYAGQRLDADERDNLEHGARAILLHPTPIPPPPLMEPLFRMLESQRRAGRGILPKQ